MNKNACKGMQNLSQNVTRNKERVASLTGVMAETKIILNNRDAKAERLSVNTHKHRTKGLLIVAMNSSLFNCAVAIFMVVLFALVFYVSFLRIKPIHYGLQMVLFGHSCASDGDRSSFT